MELVDLMKLVGVGVSVLGIWHLYVIAPIKESIKEVRAEGIARVDNVVQTQAAHKDEIQDIHINQTKITTTLDLMVETLKELTAEIRRK